MPDRTVAPALQPINLVALQEMREMRLDNDISLFYLNAGQQPVMRLEFIFNAGKWFENKPGLSFFTGKMLTEGTETKTAQEVAALFDKLGAFVEVTPGFDRITLTIHLMTRHLVTLLPLISELITKPAFRGAELQNVKQRKKQRLLVDLQKTSFVASRKFTSLVFGKDHPYGSILEVDDIDHTTVDMVSKYYDRQLTGNFEILASGMIDKNSIDSINEIFGQIPKSLKTSSTGHSEGYRPSDSILDKEGSMQSSLRLGMPFINRDHPDYIEMLVVNEILGGYFGSRLMRNIREDKGYTYGIYSGISCLKHGSLWTVSTDVKKEFRDQTVEEIIKEINILRNEPVKQDELDTVKNYLLGTFVSQTDTPFALADKFKTIHFSGLNYQYYEKYFQTVRNIDPKRVQELAREYLVLEKISKVVVG